MKKCIRAFVVLTGSALLLFSVVPRAQAEEVQTPVTVELTKAILPETYPVNSGGVTSTPRNNETVGNAGTITTSSLGKQLPQTGDRENYWSFGGWFLLFGFFLLALRKRKDKQT